jgi:hypothetical protein
MATITKLPSPFEYWDYLFVSDLETLVQKRPRLMAALGKRPTDRQRGEVRLGSTNLHQHPESFRAHVGVFDSVSTSDAGELLAEIRQAL